jgi:hypothetical protein
MQIETMRHMCRNPRCRSRLAEPVENVRSAFCARGCHTQFYRSRCMACEQPMVRKSESQRICGRRKCRSDFRALTAHSMLGRYLTPSGANSALETPDFIGLKPPLGADRPCHQIAGPALSEIELRLVTVGAGRALADNAKANRRARTGKTLVGAVPVNIVGGYRFPGANIAVLEAQ